MTDTSGWQDIATAPKDGSSVSALRERVAKLSGPDREVDRQVLLTLFGLPTVSEHTWVVEEYGRPMVPAEQVDVPLPANGDRGGSRPIVNSARALSGWELTRSVDAVLSLIERVLPGWWGDLDIGNKPPHSAPYGARLWPPDQDGIWNLFGEGTTPALALLAAVLEAYSYLTSGASDHV